MKLTTRSNSGPQPRTATAPVRDVHALAGAAELTTPIGIVAHSFGGLLARLYAQTYPTQTAAVAFVDAFPATITSRWGSSGPPPAASHPPGTEFDSDPSVERFDVDASVADVVAAPALPTVPTAVISKANRSRSPRSKPDRPVLDRVCPEQQQSLVDLRPRTPHVIAMGSDHDVQVSNPDLVADIALLVIGRIAP